MRYHLIDISFFLPAFTFGNIDLRESARRHRLELRLELPAGRH